MSVRTVIGEALTALTLAGIQALIRIVERKRKPKATVGMRGKDVIHIDKSIDRATSFKVTGEVYSCASCTWPNGLHSSACPNRNLE